MSDKQIAEYSDIILQSIALIKKRFQVIKSPDDFVSSPEGILILDGICMRLQLIGETVKKMDKCQKNVLEAYSEVNWRNIIKMRELISHHYNQIDPEIIYDICDNHVSILENAMVKIKQNAEKQNKNQF